jgi:hypothetical protein
MKPVRVHILCEGPTEESFVKNLLIPHFQPLGKLLFPSQIGKPGQKGGGVSLGRVFTDIRIRLLGDPTAYCTTFFDFYGLQSQFLGKQQASTYLHAADKARCVQEALADHVKVQLGSPAHQRFIPYVQMYEFEALLFSDPLKFTQGVGQPNLHARLQNIRTAFASPEEINDSPMTAPSKRLASLLPEYEKPLMGTLGALEIGLASMRQACPLFNRWLEQLEALHP